MKRKSRFIIMGFSSLWAAVLLGGCSRMVLFDPKGPIGDAERVLMLTAIGLMLIVVVPVIVMAFLFARRYRASNRATYRPKWNYSAKIDLVVWLVPLAVITVLGILVWSQTHRLNPYKPIDHGARPTRIEAVSLDWKWLFIYPEHHIAAVNELVFPAGVPLSFRITSDTVMTSFFIPQLGSQIYAMAGMQTRLHLMADEPGVFYGQNQQFSGSGYADMNFKAIALSPEQFENWVKKAQDSPDTLDLAKFEEIGRPSIGYPVTYFSRVSPGLFEHILEKYRSMGMNPGHGVKKSGAAPGKIGLSEEG
jgi:cytochrome o ubiquinol oxidase subunit 2